VYHSIEEGDCAVIWNGVSTHVHRRLEGGKKTQGVQKECPCLELLNQVSPGLKEVKLHLTWGTGLVCREERRGRA